MPISDIEFGDRLRRARKATGLSQGEAAELLKIKPARLSEWENGRKVPSFTRVLEVAEKLRLDPRTLVPEWFAEKSTDQY